MKRFLFSLFFCGALFADTFTVTSNVDSLSEGTLRKEITDSNTAGGTNTINFNLTTPSTITLGSSLPSIINSLTIDNNLSPGKVEVDGINTYRIFGSISASESLNLSNIDLKKGMTTSATGGGVILITSSNNPLTVDTCTFTNCTASAGNGGAIYGNSNITIFNSSFDTCSAENGGAIFGDGSFITISDASNTFSNCSAGYRGGAIFCVPVATLQLMAQAILLPTVQHQIPVVEVVQFMVAPAVTSQLVG
ncbi:MAG: hypothetical protein K940chlam8_00836 [Chlamydiae bacterium]|nr:hypothetical protein [Chlamydiota bacterium]